MTNLFLQLSFALELYKQTLIFSSITCPSSLLVAYQDQGHLLLLFNLQLLQQAILPLNKQHNVKHTK